MKSLTHFIIVFLLASLALSFPTKPVMAGPSKVEDNKAAIKRALDNFNSKDNKAGYFKLYDANAVIHGTPGGSLSGMESIKQFYTMLWAAFPDAHVAIEDLIGEEDKITVRFTFHGTHQGDFMGIPPSSKKVTMTGNTILKFAGGKCVERWSNSDSLGLMRQLGVIPSPPGQTSETGEMMAQMPAKAKKEPAHHAKEGTSMSTKENKVTARRFYEDVFNKGNIALADELFAADYVGHITASPTGMVNGSAGIKQLVTMYRNAYPDTHFTVEDTIAEGDKVVIRWTAKGTHKGELMGIAPTGKQVTGNGIDIIRLAGGKCVESWGEADMLGMLQQLGVVPMPEPKK